MTLDRLSAEDAKILKLEHSAIRGHTCKVLVLEPSSERPLPTVEELRAYVSARLGDAPRLRKRLVRTPLRVAPPAWLDDPEFEITRHVRAVDAATVSARGLQEVAARLMGERLDSSHPLWRIDVVERLEDGGMALIWRVHHALADGNSCVRLGGAALWSDTPRGVPTAAPFHPEPTPGTLGLLAQGLHDRVLGGRAPRSARLPRWGSSSRAILRRELSPAAKPTPLAHRAGATRLVAFARASLEECRRAGHEIDDSVTLNDVVLSLVAGGVRAWLEGRHAPTGGVRVKVPVSLHRPDEAEGIGNRDSYFFVDLPVAEADPVKRTLTINRETRERKLQHDAETLYRLGRHPLMGRWAMNPHVFTFNVSNVRGPAADVYVLGARVRELYSLAEIAERHTLRVAVISAAGTLFFGLCADREAVGDLRVLADGIRGSSEKLGVLVR